MNEPPTQLPQPNGSAPGANQILITLDAAGNITVTAPTNKVLALGMLTAAQHLVIGMQQQSPILPVRRIMP